MLVLKKIKLRNFISVGNEPIEIDLCGTNKTLVIGNNSAGKSSTLLDSITYGLYGVAYRNVNKNQLINSINGSELVVEIDFAVGDTDYRVVRGQAPSIFDIYQDGEKLNELSSIKEQQRFLEEHILKINYLTFSNIAILGSSGYIPFMKQPLATRRNLVEELLDINLFAQMLAVAKDSSRQLADDMSILQERISFSNEQVKLLDSFISSSTIDNTEDIILLENKIENLTNTIREKTNTQNALNTNLFNKKRPDEHIAKFTEYAVQFKTTIKSEQKKLDFYQKNDNCPTCTQLIEPDFKSESINKSQLIISDLTNRLDKANIAISTKKSLLADINVLESSIKDIEYAIKSATRQLNDAKLQLDKLKVPPRHKDPSGYITQRDIINTNLELMYAELDQLKSKKSQYAIVIKLLSDSGIKSKILEKYLPYFNSYINNYLDIFGMTINWEFNNLFKETINSRNRTNYTYDSFSEGEKMKISLAIMLAFRDLASLKSTNSTNILIMDEIFDSSLDHISTQNLMTILTQLVDHNIFIISHNNNVSRDDFDRTMEFSKFKGFTDIQYS